AATPSMSGTAEGISTVEVVSDGGSQWTTIADGGGGWSFTPSSASWARAHGITAKATDAAGNTSDESAAVTLVIDATAPIAPSIADRKSVGEGKGGAPRGSGVGDDDGAREVSGERGGEEPHLRVGHEASRLQR